MVLTGANEDGARGLKAVMKLGGDGVVEDPAGAYAQAMPAAALGACPTAKAMSLDAIAIYLQSLEAA